MFEPEKPVAIPLCPLDCKMHMMTDSIRNGEWFVESSYDEVIWQTQTILQLKLPSLKTDSCILKLNYLPYGGLGWSLFFWNSNFSLYENVKQNLAFFVECNFRSFA